MYIFQVHHYIKPEGIEAYKAVTLKMRKKHALNPAYYALNFFKTPQTRHTLVSLKSMPIWRREMRTCKPSTS